MQSDHVPGSTGVFVNSPGEYCTGGVGNPIQVCLSPKFIPQLPQEINRHLSSGGKSWSP